MNMNWADLNNKQYFCALAKCEIFKRKNAHHIYQDMF